MVVKRMVQLVPFTLDIMNGVNFIWNYLRLDEIFKRSAALQQTFAASINKSK